MSDRRPQPSFEKRRNWLAGLWVAAQCGSENRHNRCEKWLTFSHNLDWHLDNGEKPVIIRRFSPADGSGWIGFSPMMLKEEGTWTTASAGEVAVREIPLGNRIRSPSMLKKNELVEFKSLLLNLQARLRGDVQHLADGALHRAEGDGDSKSPTHIAELGTDNYEQDFSLRFVENEQEILDEITLALKKIDAGTYGLCERCLAEGKPPAKSVIVKERLKAIPYVRTCVHCAEQQRTRKWRR